MPLRKSLSFWVLLVCSASILLTSFLYYPRWNKSQTEALISWDASGYYMYLPATFIYHDLKKLDFLPAITQKYSPDPYQNQAYLDSTSGNQVMKYPAGLAVQSLPFFAAGHLAAKTLGYPTDGFSAPYQLSLQIGAELVAILGFVLVWYTLRRRFSEEATALTLVVLALGSNYLNYAAIDSAMTHNWLFTLYAGLILLTQAFYKRPTLGRALAIGAVCGLMALTRPTEVLATLIPILWGLRPDRQVLAARLAFWRRHLPHLLLAGLAGAAIGSIQPLYWHYVTGRWLVYSYGDQSFSWLRPHLYDGIFSFRSGWLTYSPLMAVALLGFGALWRRYPEVFWAMLIYSVLFIYVTFAWDIWWYGGSLGQRAMVQSYPVLAWPMAAAMSWLLAQRVRVAAFAVLLLLGIYYNLWMTHQAHGGSGLIAAGEMTRPFFWQVVGRNAVPVSTFWLLDNPDQLVNDSNRKNVRELWHTDFEQDTTAGCGTPALQGRCSLALDQTHQSSPDYRINIFQNDVQWVRVLARARCVQKEWDTWKMTQLVVSFRQGDDKVKEGFIRLQRVVGQDWPAEVYLDLQAPRNQSYDNIRVAFWNADGPQRILIDEVRVEAFER
ncbi:glycosyltransferase family 39 protein [Hymenobacter sp. APR13]|uniref:glycosyltransferase family 39 protein n=1 Tax=Hymenobacter sp. APR13 TaxID=1356852 RepID=UPI0005C4FFCF|nr:glycosyltransferase family 39 protein [Hymenobacter sp. APR13]